MSEPDDVELLAGLRRGDRAAFERFVRKYIDRIAAVAARGLGGDRHEALDVAQEVFLLAWRILPSWREGGQVFSWLYRSTLNVVSHRRRRKKPRALPSDEPEAPGAAPSGEIAEAVREALDTLPERQRDVFILRHEAGLPLAEIAEQLGLAEGTVKIHLHRALLALRDVLKLRRFL